MPGIFDRFKPTDVYTAQRLMLYLMNFGGLLPLEITIRAGQKRLKISLIGCVFLIAFACLYATWITIMLTAEEELTPLAHKTVLEQFMVKVKVINLFVLLVFLYGASWCMTKRISICMQHIANIDKKLNFIGVEINYWETFHFTTALICFVIAQLIITLVLTTIANDLLPVKESQKWGAYVTTHLPLVTLSLVECYYACVTFQIKKRYEALNRVSLLILLTFKSFQIT